MPESIFYQPIKYVKGVGEARAKILSKLGIYNVSDILSWFPRDYEDRSTFRKISEASDGEEILIKASLVSDITESRPRRNLTITKVMVSDGSAF